MIANWFNSCLDTETIFLVKESKCKRKERREMNLLREIIVLRV